MRHMTSVRYAPILAIATATLALYAGVIGVGVGLMPGGFLRAHSGLARPDAEHDRSVALGSRLFHETPVYAADFGPGRISCSNCHLEGGTAPFASPMVGIAPTFPVYSKRAGRAITLADRIEECMTRSENARPLPADSNELRGLLAYIASLTPPPQALRGPPRALAGRGLLALPALVPDPVHGAAVYAGQCAGCHGTDGQGTRRAFPPLWGATSFNDGAGMHGVDKMAAFVRVNMPHNRKGILSAQEAYDVAAYIHAQPRPAFNHAYDRF